MRSCAGPRAGWCCGELLVVVAVKNFNLPEASVNTPPPP